MPSDVAAEIERLFRRIDARRDDLVRLTQDLIRYPTINPPGDAYEACARFLGARLDARGAKVDYVRGEGEPDDTDLHPRLNVIGRFESGLPGPCIHFNGHIDVVEAGLGWTLGNLASRAAGPVNVLAYIAWSSLFAVPPLLALSLWLEGWPRIAAGLVEADWLTWGAVLWQSVGNTVFGYGAWAWLLNRYAAATVSPFALGVPVFGMGAAALVLGEPMPGWKLLATALVLAGLALNLLWPRLAQAWRRRLGDGGSATENSS